jgi:MFS family permease
MPPQKLQNQAGSSIDEGADGLREPLLNCSADDAPEGSPPPPLAAAAESGTTGNDANINKDIVLRKCCKRGENEEDATIRVNHNVFLNLLLMVLYGISNSLWSGTAYVAYLKKMGHGNNGPVGEIEAVSGLASLLCALPIGYVADKIGRSIVIRAGGILLFFTAMLQIGILEWAGTDFEDDNKDKIALYLMGGMMIFWGFGDGVVNGPCQALYADSTPEGERSRFFSYQFTCYITASAVGPLVSIIMFQTLGDEWDMYHLRIVIYVGLGMEVSNSLLMMLFDDSKALDTGDDAVGED